MVETESMESQEYLHKFGYRPYVGEKTKRINRIGSLIWFEVTSTWKKSVVGRIILLLVIFSSLMGIIFTATISSSLPIQPTEAQKIDSMHSLVASYLIFTNFPVRAGVDEPFNFGFSLSILIIALFGIAGGGLFADDKQGNVVEVYMSKLRRIEYIEGKIGAIVLYSNLFISGPLLVETYFAIQSYQLNQLKFIGLYAGIILYGFIVSLIVGLAILSLSIVMKRNYASLSFFLIYLLGSVFGRRIYFLTGNEFLLLVSPEFLFGLLAYVCVGDFNLAIRTMRGGDLQPFFLNDGVGLEYWHVLLVAFCYIAILGSFVFYKVKKLTTEDL